MNTVLMYVIMCLVCRFKALGRGFRNLKFDLLFLKFINYSCADDPISLHQLGQVHVF